MKVLVLGGTGAMGLHLVRFLADQGNYVVVTSRTRSGTYAGIDYVVGNAKDDCFLTTLLGKHWDVIVDFMSYTTPEFKARYKKLLNSTGHYIFLSSCRVYANSDSAISEHSLRLLDVIEDKGFLNSDEYALAKARQENILFDSGLNNWSIVRPYITYGAERIQLGALEKEDWLYRALKGKTIVAAKDIQSKITTLTSGDDVAKGIVAILGRPCAAGEAFHITSSTTISWHEVLNTYTKILDTFLMERPKVLLQELDLFLTWHPARYQVVYDRIYNRVFDNSKINKYINTDLFKSPEVGLSSCLESFLNDPNRSFRAINWKAEAIKDRVLSEYTPLSEMQCVKHKVKYCMYRNFPIF